ncbi:MAG: amidohydrolase family protein [Phycisphaera sp.]|nr:amidohydrolase family protein [Phycisphaera sp.]
MNPPLPDPSRSNPAPYGTAGVVAYRVGAVRDAFGLQLGPSLILVDVGSRTILDILEIDTPPKDYPTIDYSNSVVWPAMVNAHTHLDLCACDPQPYPGSFTAWLSQVLASRGAVKAAQVTQAVAYGLDLSVNAGVGYMGDIAHTPEACMARWRFEKATGTRIVKVGLFEITGRGSRERWACQEMDRFIDENTPHIPVIGLQPHAPYSTGLGVYKHAVALANTHGLHLSTHLAETEEEIEFTRDGSGPLADLLRSVRGDDADIRATGLDPIQVLAGPLAQAHWLLAHCNYVTDENIAFLAKCGASVAYCPMAHAYFHHKPHRYRDMLDAGVNVCLGTDSIVCAPPDSQQPLSILDEMRLLYRRDGTPPDTLLQMATLHGLRALGLSEDFARIAPGCPAQLASAQFNADLDTDPFEQVLRSDVPVSPI